jgi:hypothetical protein
MHEYDEKWQCKCGFRLIAQIEPETGRLNVKAYVTPEGKTIEFEKHDESPTKKRQVRSSHP